VDHLIAIIEDEDWSLAMADLPFGVRTLKDGTYMIPRANPGIEKIMDEGFQRMGPGLLRWENKKSSPKPAKKAAKKKSAS